MKRKNEFIIIFINILVIVITLKTNIFGSTMDFLNQHIVFPEYLRNTFYETGKIIPSTITIGGVENIYNIAYYGLLNPIILLSYFLPFIKMIDYVIISNIVLLMSSCLLFYKFMKTKFDDSISLSTTLLFSLSGPLIFQFHRHFMFVNYMPFLILALINIDKNKKINLMLDIFLIIMTNFYYSIPSILVIMIYYIYKNFDNLKEIVKVLIYIIIPILMSGILLLPTLGAILSTRTSTSVFDVSLLIPNINLDNILYGAYSVGLTSVSFIALIYLVYTKKRENIFLMFSIFVMSFIPFVLYLLNGGLYLRSKALIPLLPLLVYIIGIFINDLMENKIDVKKLLIFVFIINLIVLIRYHVMIYYIDLIFMIILIFLYDKIKNKKVLMIPLVLLNLVICVLLNNTENYISKELYSDVEKNIDIDTNYRITNLNNNNYTVNKYAFTPNIYSSTINKYYSNLYHNIFKVNKDTINNLELTSTSNLLFNEYMGVKYVVSDDELGYPYKKINNNIYELEQAFPIGYVNYNTVSEKYYDSLEYPYNLDILLNYVVDQNSSNIPSSNIEEVNLNYTYVLGENISIKGKKLYVRADDEILVNIKDNLENKILFIDIYNQEEQENDISLTINGQTNLLTKKGWLYPNKNNIFHYCIEGNSTLRVKFTKGIYNFDNIKTYVLDNNYIKDINNDIDKFDITDMNSEMIKGSIDVKNNGYFILSIPYDKGFDIKVNGKSTEYNLINNSFIGFYLEKGIYDIEITYNPPLLKEGSVISIIGFISLFIVIKERNKL